MAGTLGCAPKLLQKTTVQAPAAEETPFLSNLHRVTMTGRRAGEGYFNREGTKIIFQSEQEEGNPFYQIYTHDLTTGETVRVSPGTGKTTCAWIHPSGDRVLFASTHLDPRAHDKAQHEYELRASGKARPYSWDFDETFDIFEAKPDGTDLKNLTHTKGYDAEASYSPDGQWIAFASNRSAYEGKLTNEEQAALARDPSYFMELYIMRADGSGVRRLTRAAGYDGGPFFSADGSKLVWRRFAVDGRTAEVYTMNVDGTGEHQVTRFGHLSWAPFFHPSGDYIIFASNKEGHRNFELYLVDAAGTREPVRITWTDGFDGLPVFSPDGKSLLWTATRDAEKTSQLWLANWSDSAARDVLQR